MPSTDSNLGIEQSFTNRGKPGSKGSLFKAIWKVRGRIAAYLVIFFYLLIALFPLYWMFLTGIKPNAEIYSQRPTYIVQHPTLEHFQAIIKGRPTLFYFRNTAIIALATTFLCIGVGTIAAYGFAKYRFKGSNFILFSILAMRIFPPIALIVPLYFMISNIHLIDTVQGLIIVNLYLTLPFYIWIMRGFFQTLPKELDEAARIDGCSRMQAFRRVMLPISFPGMAAAAIITFMWTWNEFLFGMILSVTPAAKNISVGTVDFITDLNISWGQMSIYGFLACLPAFIFVIIFQRYIVKGLTAGAVKG
ncbi:MAG: carbohydrate ABC transporter permease [Bacillota bacterium]